MKAWAVPALGFGGLFVAGVLFFAWNRVPMWRRMDPADFQPDFATSIRRADRVQPALLVITIVATMNFARVADRPGRGLALAALAGFLVTMIASLVVLVPLQRRIIGTRDISSSSIVPMRERWLTGHLGRAGLSAVSFVFLAVAAST